VTVRFINQESDVSIMVSLESERLVLREFNEGDFEAVHRYASDPEVVKFMSWGPNTEEDTSRFLERAIGYQSQEPRTSHRLAITLKKSGYLIGGCGIRVSSQKFREGDVGYCLTRDYWGKGYATETATRLIKYGFEDLKFHRLYATCDPNNIGSSRVLEKVGMKLEGHLRENVLMRGRWRDTLIYGILEKE
jgi:ribosomal-protein-alanine N-acetyltransferase